MRNKATIYMPASLRNGLKFKYSKIAKNTETTSNIRLTRMLLTQTLLLRSRMALPATSSRVTSTLPTREAFMRADSPCYTNEKMT